MSLFISRPRHYPSVSAYLQAHTIRPFQLSVVVWLCLWVGEHKTPAGTSMFIMWIFPHVHKVWSKTMGYGDSAFMAQWVGQLWQSELFLGRYAQKSLVFREYPFWSSHDHGFWLLWTRNPWSTTDSELLKEKILHVHSSDCGGEPYSVLQSCMCRIVHPTCHSNLSKFVNFCFQFNNWWFMLWKPYNYFYGRLSHFPPVP